MPEPVTHRNTAEKDALIKRLSRVEGQVRGIKGMVEDDRHCIDIVTQITAIQAALDKVALGLLEDHANRCIIGGEDDKVDDEPQSSWEPSSDCCATGEIHLGLFEGGHGRALAVGGTGRLSPMGPSKGCPGLGT